MSKHDKQDLEKKDMIDAMEEELEELELDEINEDKEQNEGKLTFEDEKLKNTLAKVTADFENFKKRVERDQKDMVFFLKSDIFKKILPRFDDMERIIQKTPKNLKTGVLYEGVVSIEKKFKKDLNLMGVREFNSIGEKIDPEKHDVMTETKGEKDIIIEEFEKGYNLDSRVLRHAKVVVGNDS